MKSAQNKMRVLKVVQNVKGRLFSISAIHKEIKRKINKKRSYSRFPLIEYTPGKWTTQKLGVTLFCISGKQTAEEYFYWVKNTFLPSVNNCPIFGPGYNRGPVELWECEIDKVTRSPFNLQYSSHPPKYPITFTNKVKLVKRVRG